MYAQLIEGGTTPDRRHRWTVSSPSDDPRAAVEPGYAGALNLVDRDSANAI